jgi:hypothetical protein
MSGRRQIEGELAMKAIYRTGTGAALAFLGAAAAISQPATLQQRMADDEKRIAKYADSTNKACGTALEVKFDWTGANEDDLRGHSPSGYCANALEAIGKVCGDPAGKDAVKEKITSVVCSFGPQRQFSLKNGTVYYQIYFESRNDADFVYESLENEL